ncbi:hypothetical protein [Sulfurimonas lithotrophica]|nr:hypothetical protein [Sulfurimonas lithotrophica]
MPDFTQPVEMSFVFISIGAILAVTAVGIVLVKLGKKSRNP